MIRIQGRYRCQRYKSGDNENVEDNYEDDDNVVVEGEEEVGQRKKRQKSLW